jgi:hypothetical protein
MMASNWLTGLTGVRRVRHAAAVIIWKQCVRRSAILAVGLIGVVITLAAPTPSHAQSFLEALFGGGKPAPNYSAGQRSSVIPRGDVNQRSGGSTYRAPVLSPNRSSRDDDDDSSQSSGKGGKRTVCVRMCDGYYWPISYEANRGQISKDQRTCQSSCQGDAKLFHYPPTGEVADAVDSTGRTYGRLPVAFLYRKKLVAGCTCRAEAWSQSEVNRHHAYAVNDANEKTRKAEADADDAARAEAAAAKTEAKKLAVDAKPQGPGSLGKASGRKSKTSSAPAESSIQVAGDASVAPGAPVTSTASAASVASPEAATVTAALDKSGGDNDDNKVRKRRSRNSEIAAAADRTRQPTPAGRPRPVHAAVSSGLASGKFAWPGD